MPSYRWVNTQTGETREVVARIQDRDTPPDDSPGWIRPLAAPAIVGKASYLDGQRTKDPHWDRYKKAAQLKIDYAQADAGSDERRTIGRELDKLERITKD